MTKRIGTHVAFGAATFAGAALNAWTGWVPLEDGLRFASGICAGYVAGYVIWRGWK